ncbi:MAG: hypothetical protein KBD06_03280 [Candidatus Pacebacteria bacterium]|nr:hypothetical protein [Candidatus Paceibacterota bacterium]
MRYIIFLVTLLIALPVSAQELFDGQKLFMAVTPQYPKPGEAVTLTVQSPLLDLSQRTIIWRNAGTIVSEGEGETVYRFIAPSSGGRADISARVDGVGEDLSISITPLSVDLLWEADTYAPGLYRGRRLPSLGSSITLQALPHFMKDGVEIPDSQLLYTWKQNGEVLLSGRGKSSLKIPVSEFSQTNTVSVNVTTSDKMLGADRTVSIPTAEPDVRLYFEHPLYGTMYHAAVPRDTAIGDTEMTFTAIPYFASATGPNDPQFSHLWRVNKTAVEANNIRPATLTISAGAEGGTGLVELSLTHKKNFRLDAHGTWAITFGSISGTGIGADPFSGRSI